MPDTDPLREALRDLARHSLDHSPVAEPGAVRRRGDQVRRRRAVAGVAAAAAVVSGIGVAAATGLTSRDRDGKLSVTTTQTTPRPTGQLPPAASRGRLLAPQDLTGIGGSIWAARPQPAPVPRGCAVEQDPSPAGSLVTLLFAAYPDGAPLEEGANLQELVTTDAVDSCAGPGWTTLSDTGGRVVQRFNGDQTKGQNPFGRYRIVITQGDLRALAQITLGETYENDPVANQIADAMATRLANPVQRPAPSPPLPSPASTSAASPSPAAT